MKLISKSTLLVGVLVLPSLADAHVSISSGSAPADVSTIVVFGVGHGCEGADTSAVTIEIPEGVTSVRPLTSDFGQVDVETDKAGLVVAVHWSKDKDAILPSDEQYYQLQVRLKAPNAPFTTLTFPVHQTCVTEDGTEIVVDWVGDDHDDESIEPAPVLSILPVKYPGWNKFTIDADVHDLSAFFGDAEIVWKDDAAYSINPTTIELIASTEGVSSLTELEKGDEIWVKY